MRRAVDDDGRVTGEPECGSCFSQEKDAEKADDAGAEEAWGAVVAAAGRLLEQIDGEKLQASLAKRMPADADDAAKKAREEEEKQKKALLSALCATAKAQAALAQREGAEPAALEAMDETLVSRHDTLLAPGLHSSKAPAMSVRAGGAGAVGVAAGALAAADGRRRARPRPPRLRPGGARGFHRTPPANLAANP